MGFPDSEKSWPVPLMLYMPAIDLFYENLKFNFFSFFFLQNPGAISRATEPKGLVCTHFNRNFLDPFWECSMSIWSQLHLWRFCISRQVVYQYKEKWLKRYLQTNRYTNYMQVVFMRLMSNIEYFILPKGTKSTGSSKLGLILYTEFMFGNKNLNFKNFWKKWKILACPGPLTPLGNGLKITLFHIFVAIFGFIMNKMYYNYYIQATCWSYGYWKSLL